MDVNNFAAAEEVVDSTVQVDFFYSTGFPMLENNLPHLMVPLVLKILLMSMEVYLLPLWEYRHSLKSILVVTEVILVWCLSILLIVVWLNIGLSRMLRLLCLSDASDPHTVVKKPTESAAVLNELTIRLRSVSALQDAVLQPTLPNEGRRPHSISRRSHHLNGSSTSATYVVLVKEIHDEMKQCMRVIKEEIKYSWITKAFCFKMLFWINFMSRTFLMIGMLNASLNNKCRLEAEQHHLELEHKAE